LLVVRAVLRPGLPLFLLDTYTRGNLSCSPCLKK
jgi:hypothetical protein